MFATLLALSLMAPPEAVAPQRFCEAQCENPEVLDRRREQLEHANSQCAAACEKRYPNPDKTVSFVTDQCLACMDKCTAQLERDQRALSDSVEACSQSCQRQVERHPECCKTVDGYKTCTETCLRTTIKL